MVENWPGLETQVCENFVLGGNEVKLAEWKRKSNILISSPAI